MHFSRYFKTEMPRRARGGSLRNRTWDVARRSALHPRLQVWTKVVSNLGQQGRGDLLQEKQPRDLVTDRTLKLDIEGKWARNVKSLQSVSVTFFFLIYFIFFCNDLYIRIICYLLQS